MVNRENSGTAKVWGFENINGDSRYGVGEVAFFASGHHKAGCDVYYDEGSFKVTEEFDSCNSFGIELFDLLLERFESEDLVKKIKLFDNRIMLISDEFPNWGKPVKYYNHKHILTTSEWFKAKCINLNFIRNMQVDSIDKYHGYLAYFLKFENKRLWQSAIDQSQSIFTIF